MRNRANDLAIAGDQQGLSQINEMKPSLIVSAALHLILLLLIIFGLPMVHRKPIDIPDPIAVTMVAPSDIARTNHLDEPVEKPEPPKPAPTPPEPPKPPPPPAAQQQPEPVSEVKPIEQQMQAPRQLEALPELAKPAVVKLPPPKPVQQPPQKQTDQKKAQQQDQQFESLLKNLSAPVPPKAEDQAKTQEKTQPTPQAAQRATLSDKMTSDEMNAVRQQLGACWIVSAGARDAQDLVVNVEAEFNADRTLKNARIVDDGRYNSDPFYRAAADSALRALRNPACNPLMLPPDKYDVWHDMTISFNPKVMFGP